MTTIEIQILNHLEKYLITELLVKYFRAVDDKCLDMTIFEAIFTNDARIMRPNGSATIGHVNIHDGHKKSFARFKATHHVITDYIIDISETTATLRANLTAMHLWADNENNPSLNNKQFFAGAVLSAKAIKIDNDWRLCELTNRNVWRTGEGMTEMANYERPNAENP
jgi:hypothetical protein